MGVATPSAQPCSPLRTGVPWRAVANLWRVSAAAAVEKGSAAGGCGGRVGAQAAAATTKDRARTPTNTTPAILVWLCWPCHTQLWQGRGSGKLWCSCEREGMGEGACTSAHSAVPCWSHPFLLASADNCLTTV